MVNALQEARRLMEMDGGDDTVTGMYYHPTVSPWNMDHESGIHTFEVTHGTYAYNQETGTLRFDPREGPLTWGSLNRTKLFKKPMPFEDAKRKAGKHLDSFQQALKMSVGTGALAGNTTKALRQFTH